jgi:hypothetical protein
MTDPDFPDPTVWTARYHVPRSQVWEGSRGGQSGNVHLHAPAAGATLVATGGQRTTRLTRKRYAALCGRPRGWYERPAGAAEGVCPRCADYATRYGVTWPTPASG